MNKLLYKLLSRKTDMDILYDKMNMTNETKKAPEKVCPSINNNIR